MNYTEFTPILIKSIQEQQIKVKNQEEKPQKQQIKVDNQQQIIQILKELDDLKKTPK